MISIRKIGVVGRTYRNLNRYRQILAREGIELKILNSAGSVENLRLLETGKADLAFLGHGGLCKDCEECTYPHCPFGK